MKISKILHKLREEGDKNFKARVEATRVKGAYQVHPTSSPELKKAAAQLNNYIKNTNAAQPELLVSLVLAIVEAEIDQHTEDRSSELGIEL